MLFVLYLKAAPHLKNVFPHFSFQAFCDVLDWLRLAFQCFIVLLVLGGDGAR